MKNLPSIDSLEAVHTFPSRFTFKLFGANDESFASAVAKATEEVSGGVGNPEIAPRESSKGNHLCLTVTVTAQSAHHVQAFYAEYSRLPDLKLIL